MTGKQPVNSYQLFITDSLLQNVLDKTNHYGDQYVQSIWSHIPEPGHMTLWSNNSQLSELLRLIVLMITTGVVDLPSSKDYWSTSWPFCTPHFSKLLSHDGFFFLLKFLHLADNTKLAALGSTWLWQTIQAATIYGSADLMQLHVEESPYIDAGHTRLGCLRIIDMAVTGSVSVTS